MSDRPSDRLRTLADELRRGGMNKLPIELEQIAAEARRYERALDEVADNARQDERAARAGGNVVPFLGGKRK